MGRRYRISDRNRVSYVKKPLAEKSKVSAGLSAVALILFGASMTWAVRSQGQVADNTAALGLCSLLVSITGLIYSILSFAEKEKNYILAKTSAFLCGTLVIAWLMMIFVGVGG